MIPNKNLKGENIKELIKIWSQPWLLMIMIFIGCNSHNENLELLISAEQAFAKLSEEKGLRTAFLSYLAEDAIVFRPCPVLAKPIYQNRPERPDIRLTWQVEVASISAAGDMGFTSGPWQLTIPGPASPSFNYGHYVTLWKRQPSGKWLVAVDLGISHKKPEAKKALSTFLPYGKSSEEDIDWQQEILRLIEIEKGIFANENNIQNYLLHADDHIWYLRDGSLPYIGKDAVASVMASLPNSVIVLPDTVIISKSGDLAYSYGNMEYRAQEKDEKFCYLRIWRRKEKGNWLIALDIAVAKQS